MAQRTEKEETEFNIVPESITPCINNCTITVNPTTTTTSPATSSAAAPPSSCPRLSDPTWSSPRLLEVVKLPETVVETKREVNRCGGCKRKVGLSGFRCRCGELFCSTHRYSDRHDCTYDYKSAGREAIKRENPVIKAAKIVRI